MAGENQFIARVPAGGAWSQFLPPGIANRVCDFFSYGANFLPVAANGVLQADIQIQNDSNFVILAGVATVTDEENTTFLVHPAWPFTVAMNDTGAGRQLQNFAQPLGNLFGDQDWKLWVQPKFIRAGATLSTTIANLSATARNVRISFLGAKIFGYGG